MGPWLAFLVLAMPCALAFAQNMVCPEPLCKEGSACNCTCYNNHQSSRGYSLFCPGISSSENTRNLNIHARSSPGGELEVECTSSGNPSDFDLLRGLNLGPRKTFAVKFCPLPPVPFSQLFEYTGVSGVRNLYIQSFANYSNLLTRNHFRGLGDIRQLTATHNMLTDLPEDLLMDMGNLTWLTLRENLIPRLTRTFFRPVPKLEVLELGSNKLSYLEPGTFRNLTKLRLLNLWGNRLKNLSRGVFSDLPNLESLDLSNNALVTIPPDIFSDLPKLKNINFQGNRFVSLPQGLFSSNPHLEKFQISSNHVELLVMPPGLLANLTELHEVVIRGSSVSTLPEDFLWGSHAVINVNLSENSIISLPVKLFKDNRELAKVDLSYNKITSVPDEFFYSQSNLVELNLSNNEIKNISASFFKGLRNLGTLDLSHNNISHVARQPFPENLISVDLSHNQISDLTLFEPIKDLESFGSKSVFNEATSLKHLNLAYNRLEDMSYGDWHNNLVFLEHLDLSHNNFSYITTHDVFFGSRLNLDLSNNSISTVDFSELENVASFTYGSTPKSELSNRSTRVSLKGNPFKCDCKLYDFMRLISGNMDVLEANYIVEIADNPSDLICHAPIIAQSKSFEEVLPMDVNCPWEELHNNSECPSPCTCLYRPHKRSLIVDCSAKNLTSWPEALPLPTPDTSESVVNTWSRMVDQQTMVANHTVLYLYSNRLSKMPDYLHHSYRNVTFLYLSYNHLNRINLTHFSPSLQVLELNNNNFTTLGKALQQIENLKNLSALSLRNNPWQCDCSAKEFLKFVQTEFRKVDYNNISCSTGEKFENLTSSDLCPFSGTAIFIGSAIIALIGLLIGGLFALYFRYQRAIDVWLYAHGMCLWFVTEEELDKDKIFDAFISYSSEDESFVVNELVKVLEGKQPKYKLCLHYRDWIAGDLIPRQIARSVDESKRTVVVLSPSFLKSVWGRMEFRTAHSQALKEKRCKVIVILYGDIGKTDNLDPELKSYLDMNTYVKWGDPWFWEKLFYALPHPPEVTKGIPSFFRRQRRYNDDKLTDSPHNFNIIKPLETLSNTKPV